MSNAFISDLLSSISERGRTLLRRAGSTDETQDTAGLIELCELKRIARAYVVTKSLDDFGLMKDLPKTGATATRIMRIPAPLLCYWMGAAELESADSHQ